MLSASSWWMGLVNAKRHRSQNCNGSRQIYLHYRVSNCGNVRQWRATSSKGLLVSLQKATRVTTGVRKQNQMNAVEMTMLWPMALTQQHVFHLELPRSCCSSILDLTLIVMISAKYQSTFSCFFPWGRKIVFRKEGTGVFVAVQHVKPPPGISCEQQLQFPTAPVPIQLPINAPVKAVGCGQSAGVLPVTYMRNLNGAPGTGHCSHLGRWKTSLSLSFISISLSLLLFLLVTLPLK